MSSGGCQLHPSEKVAGQCGTCGKTICVVCTKLYGYFCSAECKAKAKSRAPATAEGAEMAAFGSRMIGWIRIFTITVVPLTALALGAFVIWTVTSREGKLVWTFKPEKDRAFSAILPAGELVMAACDNTALYGLDKRTGQAVWGFEGQRGFAERAPIPAGDRCIVADYTTLYCVNAQDGKPLWQHAFPEGQRPEPVVGGKHVAYLYQTMREMTKEEARNAAGPIRSTQVVDAAALCVIRLEDGAELWRKTFNRTFFAGGEMEVGNETVYYGTHLSEKEVEAESAEAKKTAPGPDPAKPAADPKPAKDKPKNEDDPATALETARFVLTAFDAATGKGKWKAVLEGGSGYSVQLQATATGLLVTTGSNIYSLAEADGKVLWKHPVPKVEFLFWNPQVRGELVFVPDNNVLHCIDLKTGEERWQFRSDSEYDPAEPLLEGDTVFLNTYVQEERKIGQPGEGLPTYRGTEELVREFQKDLPKNATVAVSELLALDARTGQTKWRLRDVGSRLILGDGILIGLRYHTFATTTETRITAVQAATGQKLWESVYIGKVTEGCTDGQRFYMAANSGVERITFSSRQPPRDNLAGAYSIGR